MKFAEFQKVRAELLRDRADIIDCSATNLYEALAYFIPVLPANPERTVHRCHLATEWTETFGFPPEAARRALVSCGVRDCLGRLFRHYASEAAQLWLPSDNYPVYGELAREAGLDPREFATLPTPEWPSDAPLGDSEVLLVTNPLKPLGRWLTDADVSALISWLARSSLRRVVLDSVYTFDLQFHEATRRLLMTGQVILLHSLTKGWLHPRLFGIALVPEEDASALAPVFRDQPPPQQNLARARTLMSQHAMLPRRIASVLNLAQRRLLAALPSNIPVSLTGNAPGYFIPIHAHWSGLLADNGVLGLPASVFGSSRQDITILSSLNFVS